MARRQRKKEPRIESELREDLVALIAELAGVSTRKATEIVMRVVDAMRADTRLYATKMGQANADLGLVARTLCARFEFALERLGRTLASAAT